MYICVEYWSGQNFSSPLYLSNSMAQLKRRSKNLQTVVKCTNYLI